MIVVKEQQLVKYFFFFLLQIISFSYKFNKIKSKSYISKAIISLHFTYLKILQEGHLLPDSIFSSWNKEWEEFGNVLSHCNFETVYEDCVLKEYDFLFFSLLFFDTKIKFQLFFFSFFLFFFSFSLVHIMRFTFLFSFFFPFTLNICKCSNIQLNRV